MTTMPTTDKHRLTCHLLSPRNPHGREKLVATIVTEGEQGLWVWCKCCLHPYFITREACIAAWERGEAVVKGCGHR